MIQAESNNVIFPCVLGIVEWQIIDLQCNNFYIFMSKKNTILTSLQIRSRALVCKYEQIYFKRRQQYLLFICICNIYNIICNRKKASHEY